MTTTEYIINVVLVLLVVAQIRERRLDLMSFVLPVALVGIAATQFLHTIPSGGNDLVLVVSLVALGALLGWLCGLFTHVRRDASGVALARAGWVAGALWIGGIGSRIAFSIVSEHGLGGAIDHFSVAHHITSSAAWTAAFVLMALCEVLARTTTLAVRSRKMTRRAMHRAAERTSTLAIRNAPAPAAPFPASRALRK